MGGGTLEVDQALIGRDAELGDLCRALASPGGFVLVSGEGGIGKTRLVRVAAGLAHDEGRPVVWARPEQVTRPGPFALILDLVENLAGQNDSSVAAEARALSVQLLEPGAGTADALPVRRIAAQLRGLLTQLGHRPVAVFEDLHVADELSHAVIVHLARSAPDDGHFLIGTYRPEELGAADELERFLGVIAKERLAASIVVDPLDREESARLAQGVLGDAAGAGQVEWIARTAEGVPFFIEELAAAYLRTGSVAGVPDTISRAVLARGQRLGAVARQVVSSAALASGPIDPDVLAAACELDPGTVARALSEAARAGLVEDRGERLAFRHALVREAIVADLVSVEAQELHRRLAAAIERVHADQLGLHAKALAHHWYSGRERERAWKYAILAGDRALALAATHDARLAFELAVACTDVASPEAMTGLAEVDVREGRPGDAEELFRRAAGAFIGEGRAVEAGKALSRVAWVQTVGQRYEDATATLDEALDLVKDGEHLAERARFLAQKGRVVQAGSADERRGYLEEADEIAQRISDHGLRADCLDGLSWLAYETRDGSAALSLGAAACAEALLTDSAEVIGRTHNNLSLMLAFRGDPDRGLGYLSVARERLARSFGSLGVSVIDLSEAITRWRMGQPNQVERLVARREVAWTHWRSYTRILQAWSAFHAGDRIRAFGIVQKYREEIGWAPAPDLDASGLDEESSDALLCELLVRLEDGDAEVAGRAAAALAYKRGGAPEEHVLASTLAARAALLAGDQEMAERAIAETHEVLEDLHAPYFGAMALELEARLVHLRNDAPRAIETARAAAETFGSCSNVVDRARCLRLAGELLGPTSKDEAIEALRSARDLAMEAGSHLEIARTEAAQRALGVRPRAGRPKKGAEGAGGLSTREEEIAALVAAGATNADIAARLFLSERTVQDHITHALRKLGLSGRAGLAAWAVKQGIV